MSEALHALLRVVDLGILAHLVLGVALGLVGGALPGVTITLTLALLLPFTFYVSPEAALALLLGAYVAGFTGGAFSAITLNIPGTPSAAGTAIDGYPLARKGEADWALFLAVVASFLGGLVGWTVLVLFTPIVAGFALRFGPPEIATLVLSALTLVIVFSSGDLVKGLLSAALGASFAMVGLDPLSGVPRYTLGRLELQDGIPFLVALIGLFAYPQLLLAVGARTDVFVPSVAFRLSRLLRRVFSWILLKVIAVSGLLGALVGAIPGTGGPIAVFLAYGAVRRFVPVERRRLLGQGAEEGVAACEAANSAVTPGAMMPLITLGIPGDPVTAILLGALIIHGLAPGPLFFQNHRDFVFEIFALLFMAIVATALMALVGARALLLALRVPQAYLVSLIAVLVTLGTYSIRNSFFDVGMALGFGLLGYILLRQGFSLIPLLLALILFEPLERNFRLGLTLSGGDLSIFVTRPLALLFLVIACLAFVLSLRNERIRAARSRS